MTAKEKAKELVDRFYLNGIKKYSMQYENSVQCALICVDEFIDALSFNSSPTAEGLTEFYTEVKIEINKL
jgi:hypothetical protein|tara:strand:+ start:259 stop:468 length:210 start_codon:yes stop_codon:yes gene_type:complete